MSILFPPPRGKPIPGGESITIMKPADPVVDDGMKTPIPRSRAFSLGNISVSDLEELFPESPDGKNSFRRTRVFSIDVDPALEIDEISLTDQSLLMGGAVEVDFKVNRDRGMSFEFFAFQSDEAGEIGAISSITTGPRITLPNSTSNNGGSTVRFDTQNTVDYGLSPPRTPNRPRGDSIIFDPRSFADGGIHETAALAALETPLKQRLERGMQLEEVDEERGEEEEYIKNWREKYENRPNSMRISDSKISVSNVIDDDSLSRREKMKLHSMIKNARTAIASKAKPKKRRSVSSPKSQLTPKDKGSRKQQTPQAPKKKKILVEKLVPPPVLTELASDLYISSISGEKILANSAVVLLSAALNGNLFSGGFDMQASPIAALHTLNKAGRIGIYTKEQRRARVQKFHSKRKMRIWRKRIKYDCRKKLADSRPRIKGRFVKRSDAGNGKEGKGEVGEGYVMMD